jgi:GTP-binding protein Era
MKKLLNGPVHLELFVKIIPNWRKKESKLMELGYEVDY